MATLRETLDDEIAIAQTRVNELRAQIDSPDPTVQKLLGVDLDVLQVFFKIFRDRLGL